MNPLERGRNLLHTVRTGTQHAVDKAQQTVSQAANTVAQGGHKVGQFVDGFETKAADKARALGGL